MRHAQSEGTLGEILWAAGKREMGIAAMRKSVAEFEALSAEDPQNAVFVDAGAQVRGYLALALNGGPEAVGLAEKNVRLRPGADAKSNKGRERSMVYGIGLGSALLSAGRIEDAARQLHAVLERNRDWDANADLRWSALHLLEQALEKQHRNHEAMEAAREERQAAKDSGESDRGFCVRVLRAIAARDYASAIAHDSIPLHAEAVRDLDRYATGVDDRYGALAGALIAWAPKAAEIKGLRKRLE
jgi:tetratricopeptide (TPR) repeat protein